MSLCRWQSSGSIDFGRIVHLNVGGVKYTTATSTLRSESCSFFDLLMSGRWDPERDADGSVFIDRNGDLFKHVLEYLRAHASGEEGYRPPVHDVDELLALEREANYYQLPGLTALCRELIHGFGSREPVLVVACGGGPESAGSTEMDNGNCGGNGGGTSDRCYSSVYWRVRNVWHVKDRWSSPRFRIGTRELELGILPGQDHFRLALRLCDDRSDCETIGRVVAGVAASGRRRRSCDANGEEQHHHMQQQQYQHQYNHRSRSSPLQQQCKPFLRRSSEEEPVRGEATESVFSNNAIDRGKVGSAVTVVNGNGTWGGTDGGTVNFTAAFEGWHDFGQNKDELIVDRFLPYESMLFPWNDIVHDGMIIVRVKMRFVNMLNISREPAGRHRQDELLQHRRSESFL